MSDTRGSRRSNGAAGRPATPPGSPMAAALAEARRAAAAGEVPVGAVVARGRAVLATGHNLTRTLGDPTAHAEIVAIRRAALRLGTDRLEGLDLHVTLEPCPMCAGAIAHARIARLYFGALDPKGGGVEHGARVFSHPTCHHVPEVYGGIAGTEARALLRDFFARRR